MALIINCFVPGVTKAEKSTFNAHAIGSGSFYNMKERKYV